MSRHFVRPSSFEARSLVLIASVTLGMAGSAYAQSTAAPATATTTTDAQVSAAFTKADKNSDGKLTRDEAASLPAVSASFDKADTNKDGTLSTAEFSKAMKM